MRIYLYIYSGIYIYMNVNLSHGHWSSYQNDLISKHSDQLVSLGFWMKELMGMSVIVELYCEINYYDYLYTVCGGYCGNPR